MPHIALYGGEQDGQLIPDADSKNLPEVYYAVPLAEDGKLKEVRGQQKKKQLQQKLGTLAYKFEKEVVREGVGKEYVYVRAPQLDKKAPAQ